MRRISRMRIGAIAVGVAALAMAAGCSSSSSSGTTTTSTTGAGGGGGSGTAANLTQFESRVTNGKGLTYKATYSLSAPGESGTFVVERMPPSNNRFDVSTSGQQLAIISRSATTYVCDLSKVPPACVSGITDPLASLEKLVDPAQIIPNLQQAAAAGTTHVTFSSQTVYGMPSTCAAITSPHQGTFCVTDQGLLASVSASTGSITLTGYTTSVSASDFAPPAGATIDSVPPGSP